jgi:trk system potassium uptake protein TrkH
MVLVLALDGIPRDAGNPSLTFGDKLLNAFFQSTTLRTAGFSTLDQSHLTDSTKLIGVMFMFVGASPASTGGGVENHHHRRGDPADHQRDPRPRPGRVFGKQLPVNTVKRALAVVVITWASC